MTCIVAVENTDGSVIMGADRAVTEGDSHVFLQSTPKIWKVGRGVLGVSGSAEASTALEYADLPEPTGFVGDPVRWTAKLLVPAIRAALEAAGAGYDPAHPEDTNYTALFALDGAIMRIGPRGDVIRISGYAAIGSATPYACGALEATKDVLDPRECAEAALCAAACLDPNVREGVDGFDFLVAPPAGVRKEVTAYVVDSASR